MREFLQTLSVSLNTTLLAPFLHCHFRRSSARLSRFPSSSDNLSPRRRSKSSQRDLFRKLTLFAALLRAFYTLHALSHTVAGARGSASTDPAFRLILYAEGMIDIPIVVLVDLLIFLAVAASRRIHNDRRSMPSTRAAAARPFIRRERAHSCPASRFRYHLIA